MPPTYGPPVFDGLNPITTLLPVLRPLLRQELLRGDKTRGMSTLTPGAVIDPLLDLEPTCCVGKLEVRSD